MGLAMLLAWYNYIHLEYLPSISLLPTVFFPCANSSNSSGTINTTISTPNPCGLPLQIAYEDPEIVHVCPSEFVCNWTINVCNNTATQSQSIVLYNPCLPDECGRNESIPRDIISFGKCQCNRPWFGEDCDILIHEPVIVPMDNAILDEAQQYSIVLNVSQGSTPLSWILLSGPLQLSVNQFSGQVSWARAQAGNHTVVVQVEHQVGQAEVAWNLTVIPGYKASTPLTYILKPIQLY